MNPVCCVCDETATYICRHPDCDQPPYLCAGPCIKGASQRLHTHNKGKNIIRINEFMAVIEEINDTSFVHNEHIEKMKKRANILKDSFNAEIDRMITEHENDLKNEIKMTLKKQSKDLLDRISSDMKGEGLTGKQVHMLVKKQNIYEREKYTFHCIEFVKRQFENTLNRMENLKVLTNYMSWKERYEEMEEFCDEGFRLLKYEQKFQEGLKQYQKAKELVDFNQYIYNQIGVALYNLGRTQQALVWYKKCFQIDPQYTAATNNIGVIYRNSEDFKQAIKWYSKAIEINQTNPLYYANRAYCYSALKMLEQSHADYEKAFKLNPIEEYSQSLKEVEKEMASQSKIEAKADMQQEISMKKVVVKKTKERKKKLFDSDQSS